MASEIHTDDETEVAIDRGALAVPERFGRYQRIKAQVTSSMAVDVLLDGTQSWLVVDTPDGAVIVLKGQHAALSEMVRAELHKRLAEADDGE